MERAWIEYILNALWQLPLLAAGAWLLLRALNVQPATQHRIWLAVLAFAVLLPTRGILTATQQTPPECAKADSLLLAQNPGLLLPAAAPVATERRFTARLLNVRLTPVVAHVVAGLFLSMVLLGTARVAFAWRAANQLVQQSQPTKLSVLHSETIQSCSHHLHVALPEIRESSALSSPVLVGALSPVLLLPIGFDRHTPDQIKAALCHELAHLRRQDYLVNLLCRLGALPVEWHPVTHMIQRQIRRTCEMTCDALAAQHMCSELGYAKCLLALAQSMLQGRTPATHSPALGLFENNTLEERVVYLLGQRNAMSLHAKLARLVAGATGMGAAIVVAAVFHLTPVMAQQTDAIAPQQVQNKPVPSPSEQSKSAPIAIARGDHAKVSAGKGTYIHRWKAEDGKTVVMANRDRRDPTAEEQRQVESHFAEALKEPIPEKNLCNNPEFKLQIAEARNAAQFTQSPEFKEQMAEVRRQVQSAEFKKQMAEMQEHLKSDEFKRQIELQKLHSDLQKQMADMQEQFKSGQFKQQMEALQKQFQSGEFKQQMEKATQAIRDAQEQFKNQHAQ